MKSLLFAFALICLSFTTKAFANDIKTTPAVQQSFYAAFSNAQNVQWQTVDQLYKASFLIDGQEFSAFFDADGTLIAASRYIQTQQLPLALQIDLKKRLAAATLVELFEINKDGNTNYYATISKGGKSTILKSDSQSWSIYKD
jgi:hypothetical protein